MYNKEGWENYIENDNIEAIKYLLDNNLIDINFQDEDRWSLLMHASCYNYVEMVKLLLSYKNIDINCQNKWKDTALILASYWNNKIETVKLLLNYSGINIFLKNYQGKTVLDIAKIYNYKEIETLLINHDRREKLKLLKYI
jgi:ankyrin repeat protein